jgi:signal transduction histidine kinase
VDLVEEIRHLVDIYRMAARGEGRNVFIEARSLPESLYCRVDRDRINQAVGNLVRNGMEAVEDGGRVTVSLGVKRAPAAGGRSEVGRGYVRIEVTDDGPGIAKEDLERVFSPYVTTKRGGTGLGLPTVKRIVALHGGVAGYSPVEPTGSRFVIEIPRR